MVVAVVALSLALTGGAGAAGKLISGKSIKNNSITSSDLKNNSVKSTDVRNGSLLKKDFKAGQLPAGPAGPSGASGRNGVNGFGEVDYSQGTTDLAHNTTATPDTFADCPTGTVPTGGDAFYVDAASGESFSRQVGGQGISVDANGDPAGWVGTPIANDTPDDQTFVVEAICANASQIGFFDTIQALRGAKRRAGKQLYHR